MPEGHVFSGLQNRVGPLSIAPAGTKDYSVCSVRPAKHSASGHEGLQRMFGTGDDIVLGIRRQGGEECRVSSDADH